MISSREFNQDVGRAKRAAQAGPVIITSRGRPSHVLLQFKDFQRLTGQQKSIVELLSLDSDVEFEPPKLEVAPKIPEFD